MYTCHTIVSVVESGNVEGSMVNGTGTDNRAPHGIVLTAVVVAVVLFFVLLFLVLVLALLLVVAVVVEVVKKGCCLSLS